MLGTFVKSTVFAVPSERNERVSEWANALWKGNTDNDCNGSDGQMEKWSCNLNERETESGEERKKKW